MKHFFAYMSLALISILPLQAGLIVDESFDGVGAPSGWTLIDEIGTVGGGVTSTQLSGDGKFNVTVQGGTKYRYTGLEYQLSSVLEDFSLELTFSADLTSNGTYGNARAGLYLFDDQENFAQLQTGRDYSTTYLYNYENRPGADKSGGFFNNNSTMVYRIDKTGDQFDVFVNGSLITSDIGGLDNLSSFRIAARSNTNSAEFSVSFDEVTLSGTSAVPEPTSMVLFGLSLPLLILARRKNLKR